MFMMNSNNIHYLYVFNTGLSEVPSLRDEEIEQTPYKKDAEHCTAIQTQDVYKNETNVCMENFFIFFFFYTLHI